jgi:hypothetical protein
MEKQLNVLVVDDEAMVRLLAKAFLDEGISIPSWHWALTRQSRCSNAAIIFTRLSRTNNAGFDGWGSAGARRE